MIDVHKLHPPIRDQAEIQRAHDILRFVLVEEPFELTKEQNIQIIGCMNTLCWVLNHESAGDKFAEHMRMLTEEIESSGFKLPRIDECN